MKHRLLALACLVAAIITAGHAATSTSTTSQALQLSEFGGTLAAGKSYKVTRSATISASATLPGGCSLYVMPGGSLTVQGATLTCGDRSQLVVLGGQLKLSNGNIKLGSDTHLGLEATSITGTGTITAGGTSLTAPIKQIFSPGVSVKGSWTIDRAYPQWFATGTSTTDWSEAINKAIAMKVTGEVMLPRGTYTLQHTIYVPMGIHFTGEPGSYAHDSANHGGTVLRPAKKGNAFNGGYMLMVNVKHDQNTTTLSQSNAQWEVAYAIAGTEVSYLSFDCNSGTTRYKAILAAGASTISTNCFHGCLQAVAYINGTYSDMRRITGNTFNAAGNSAQGQKRDLLYAFDICGLGDALVFEGNAVHSGDNYTRALHLSVCNGAQVTANILNADIVFENCKAISYTGNHSENGAQLTLKESSVTMSSNFFEKGTRPSVVIKGGDSGSVSTVAMNGTQFLYYNGGQRSAGETLQQICGRVASISETDVAIDKKSSLTVTGSYRYDLPGGSNSVGAQYPLGLNVAQLGTDGSIKQSSALRRLSPALARSGKVASGLKGSVTTPASPGQASISLYGAVGTLTWLGQSGTYSYSCKIMDTAGNVTKQLASMTDYKNRRTAQTLTQGGNGLLFNVKFDPSWGDEPQPMLVQLTRRGPDGTRQVTVPLAATRSFYDNGLAIAGYKWQ